MATVMQLINDSNAARAGAIVSERHDALYVPAGTPVDRSARLPAGRFFTRTVPSGSEGFCSSSPTYRQRAPGSRAENYGASLARSIVRVWR